MNNFEWNFTTRLIYGHGRITELGDIVKSYGNKVLLATYKRDEAFTPIIDKTISILKSNNIDFELFEAIETNPRVETIDNGVELFKESGCDCIVALGGGSVIDGAKYIAATAFSGGSSWDYVVLG